MLFVVVILVGFYFLLQNNYVKKSHSTYESFIPLKENEPRRAGSSEALSTLRDITEDDDQADDGEQTNDRNNNIDDDVNNTQETDYPNGHDIDMDAADENQESADIQENGMDTETEVIESNVEHDDNLISQVSGYNLPQSSN